MPRLEQECLEPKVCPEQIDCCSGLYSLYEKNVHRSALGARNVIFGDAVTYAV